MVVAPGATEDRNYVPEGEITERSDWRSASRATENRNTNAVKSSTSRSRWRSSSGAVEDRNTTAEKLDELGDKTSGRPPGRPGIATAGTVTG